MFVSIYCLLLLVACRISEGERRRRGRREGMVVAWVGGRMVRLTRGEWSRLYIYAYYGSLCFIGNIVASTSLEVYCTISLHPTHACSFFLTPTPFSYYSTSRTPSLFLHNSICVRVCFYSSQPWTMWILVVILLCAIMSLFILI